MKIHHLLTAAVAAFVSSSADAAVTISITQNGANVVSTASGTFDTTLSSPGGAPISAYSLAIVPSGGFDITGVSGGLINFYSLTGPTSFGSGGVTPYDTTSGLPIGLNAFAGVFFLSSSYVSNSAIASSGTINNATLAGLGLTTGVYEYTVGGNSLTINVGQSVEGSVPEPATWAMMLLGFAGIGYALRRRTRKQMQFT